MQNKSEVSSPKIHEFLAFFYDKVKDPRVSRTWFYSTLEQGSLSRLIFLKGQLADVLVFAGHMISGDFLMAQTVKSPHAMQETQVQFWGQKDSPGEGNDSLSQYSCLENPRDRGTWQATVHGVAKSHNWVTKLACLVFVTITHFSYCSTKVVIGNIQIIKDGCVSVKLYEHWHLNSICSFQVTNYSFRFSFSPNH